MLCTFRVISVWHARILVAYNEPPWDIRQSKVFLSRYTQTGGSAQWRCVHVRLTESLTRRTGHHLNHTVQDYFGSGILGLVYGSTEQIA